jgi:hypothetical protein
MHKSIFSIVFLCLSVHLSAQNSTGRITSKNANEEAIVLPGANVFWLGTTIGTSANTNGHFELPPPPQWPWKMVVQFVGYQSDTIAMSAPVSRYQVELKPGKTLKTIEVTERQSGTRIDALNPILVEEVGAKELTRAACCNLSETFETNASVDVVTSDAVTGSKKIQMLGLDGIYTAMQLENIPYVRGLLAKDGMGAIPGTWLSSIQISKGAGTVVNGYESMTGQINLEYLKPHSLDERIFVNLYGNTMGRREANVHFGGKLNEKWSALIFLHGNQSDLKVDNNRDGFLDMPLKKQVNIFNRWRYEGKNYMVQFGGKAFVEQNDGGQTDFDHSGEPQKSPYYGTQSQSKFAMLFFKNGYTFEGTFRSIAAIARASYHDVNWYAGRHDYRGINEYFYTNIIYQDILRTTDHNIKAGVSFVFDRYTQQFNGTAYDREEQVPGLFAEYTFKRKKLTLVPGLRADFHNLYGTFISPRVHMKYDITKRGALRLSAGKGFKPANIFTDNFGVYVNQRNLALQRDLYLPEVSWNSGISFTQNFLLWARDASFSTEYFYTFFENQVIYDRETPGLLAIYNLNGTSYAHAVQAELSYEFVEGLELRIASKFQEVRATLSGQERQVPLVPNWRGMATLGYETQNRKWQADLTAQFTGLSRIPDTKTHLPENRRNVKSDSYAMLNTQLTRRFRKWEVYAGVENILDYKQPNAIISADSPFHPEFDASLMWAPVNGRVIYGGLRLKFF